VANAETLSSRMPQVFLLEHLAERHGMKLYNEAGGTYFGSAIELRTIIRSLSGSIHAYMLIAPYSSAFP